MHPAMQVEPALFQPFAVCVPCHPVHSSRSVRVQSGISPVQGLQVDMVQQRREPFLRFPGVLSSRASASAGAPLFADFPAVGSEEAPEWG